MRSRTSAIGLAAAALFASSSIATAATTTGTMVVDAYIVPSCEITSGGAIHFGFFFALQSTGDKTANSGTTFKVACSKDAAPVIYSTSARVMTNGTNSLPFNLSLTNGAVNDDLPSDPGSAVSPPGLVQDGSPHSILIYGRTKATDFMSLPTGPYSTNVVISIDY